MNKTNSTAPRSEFRKIGYSLIVIGIIALTYAWLSIFQHLTSLWELLFLFIGLVATLGGINLVIRNATTAEHPLQTSKTNKTNT